MVRPRRCVWLLPAGGRARPVRPRGPVARRLRSVTPMGAAPRLLAPAGLAIHAHAGWLAVWAILTLILGSGGLPATLLLFVAAVVHALAQGLAAWGAGLRIRRITLHVFGGVPDLEGGPASPRAAALVALAGPAASLVVAAGAAGLASVLRPVGPGLLYLATAGAAVGLVNLLPGDPVDGGRLLRALTWWRTGRPSSRAASTGGAVVRFALVIAGGAALLRGAAPIGAGLILLALFLRDAAAASSAEIALREALTPVKVREAMTRSVVAVPPEASIAQLVETFWAYHFASFPVMSEGAVVGLVDVRDVAAVGREHWPRTRVRTLMRPLGVDLVVAPDDTLLAALAKASRNGIGRLIVLDDRTLAGYLTSHDITDVLTDKMGGPEMAPQTPPRSGRPGAAVAALGSPPR